MKPISIISGTSALTQTYIYRRVLSDNHTFHRQNLSDHEIRWLPLPVSLFTHLTLRK